MVVVAEVAVVVVIGGFGVVVDVLVVVLVVVVAVGPMARPRGALPEGNGRMRLTAFVAVSMTTRLPPVALPFAVDCASATYNRVPSG